MTGPAEGKLPLQGEVYLCLGDKKVKLKNVSLYIHLKGYALARVTHLDIEHENLNGLIPPKHGKFLTIRGVKDGIEIVLDKPFKEEFKLRKIQVVSPILNLVLSPNQKTRTWVGGKVDGIYVGFRKPEIKKLEEVAEKYLKLPFHKP